MLKDDEDKIVRWELPLHKIIPKKLYEAQQSAVALMPDDQLLAAAQPDSIDWRLRIKYNALLQKYMDPMSPKDSAILQEEIYKDVCTYDTFKRRIDIAAKAVFITRRIGSYTDDQDALLTAFSTRMWEIASASLVKPDGSLDIEATKLVHKTIQILLDRKFGQAVQRQISVGVQNPSTMDPVAIEAQLRALEAADGK
jgi:hypothetical protein